MDKYKRKSIATDLNKFCVFAKENDFIEITEWKNGEGYDISISKNNENKLFMLTRGEIQAIKKIVKKFDKEPLNSKE